MVPVDADAGDWCVLLIGGASGAGKSQVSYPLARQFGVSVLETDDLVTAVKAATSPAQLPLLHYWDTHPQAREWTADRIADLTVEANESLQAVFDAVIADHLDTGVPVVIEGDHLLPELARDRAGVRGVILDEPDVDRLAANYAGREPGSGQQRLRAEVSALLGARLADRARAVGVPVVAARPWTTTLHRTAMALGLAQPQ
jgi:2-phosphoglycerate kinase